MTLESTVIDNEEPDDDIGSAEDIILHPRKAFRGLVHEEEGMGIALLLIYVASVYSGLLPAANQGKDRSLGEIFAWALMANGLLGLIFYAIIAAITQFVSSWFNGRGSYAATFRAYAWSTVPSMLGLTLTILAMAFFGEGMYLGTVEGVEKTELLQWTYYFFYYGGLALSAWQVVLLVIGISVAQHVSIVDAILILITPAVILAAIVAGIWFLNAV